MVGRGRRRQAPGAAIITEGCGWCDPSVNIIDKIAQACYDGGRSAWIDKSTICNGGYLWEHM
jgi:hypothetical protein